MRYKNIFFCFTILIVLSSGSIIFAELEKTYEIKVLEEEIFITSPVKIVKIDMFDDGGTTFVELKDDEDRIIRFCKDGRMMEKFPRFVYINAFYPTDEGAKKVPMGGEEENVLLEILEDWLTQNHSKEFQEELFNAKSVIPYENQEDEYKAYRVVRLIKLFRKRFDYFKEHPGEIAESLVK